MLRIIPVLLTLLLNACVTNPSGRVRPDPQVFSSEGFIPLGTGLVGAIICNKLFEGHGSKEGWKAALESVGNFLVEVLPGNLIPCSKEFQLVNPLPGMTRMGVL